jgi:hypothetical protein
MSSPEVDAAMPAPTEITVQQLSRQTGLPGAPAIIDVRLDGEYRADPRLVPAAIAFRMCRTGASNTPADQV